MNLSMAWTTKVYLAGKKTCTRRDWSERYFQQWVRAWAQGRRTHTAISRRLDRGGVVLPDFNLTCCPYQEALRDMPEEDLIAEGGLWASLEEFIMLFGGNPDKELAVVRFQIIRVEPRPVLQPQLL